MNATSPELHRDYAGDPSTLRMARRDVVDFLLECGADNATVETASLVVSELATNAIQAAPDSPYHLRLQILDPDVLSLSIRNRSTGTVPPPAPDWRPTDDLAVRGRGLSIVDSLADEVMVDAAGDEVVVTARIRLTRSL